MFVSLHYLYEASRTKHEVEGRDMGSATGYSHAVSILGGRPSQSTRSKTQESGVDVPEKSPLYQVGEQVKFYDKSGILHYGVVRWTGDRTAARKARKFPYTVVGIQTVS